MRMHQISCVVCSWWTENQFVMESMNQFGMPCPDCQNELLKWEWEDGTIRVTLPSDESEYLELKGSERK